MLVHVPPCIAHAERELLPSGQATNRTASDRSGGEGVAGIEEVSAVQSGLNRTAVPCEAKRMQINSTAVVFKFDPNRKPVLSRGIAEPGEEGQDLVELLGVNGEVKIMMAPGPAPEQGVDCPAACDPGSYVFRG